jgi:UrcA family protein
MEPIMESRKIACFAAAGFIGVALTAATAHAQPPDKEVVIEGKRLNPETQRVVRYADLNLANQPEQRLLLRRISVTARSLCLDLGHIGFRENWACTSNAIDSTDDQVAAAISRAKDKLAGKPVGPAIAITMVIGAR